MSRLKVASIVTMARWQIIIERYAENKAKEINIERGYNKLYEWKGQVAKQLWWWWWMRTKIRVSLE